MPELPEVETIRRQLNETIVAYRIVEVWFDNPKSLQPSPAVFIQGVKGQIIEKVERRGKLLIFRLKSGGIFIAHLKLTGRLLVRRASDPADDFAHVILQLNKIHTRQAIATQVCILVRSEKIELRFADARKFGFLRFLRPGELKKILSEFGPEPLRDLTIAKLQQILSSATRKIKEVLMNQKTIAGIGNIYANESLWLAKIHPETVANELNKEQVGKLFAAIEEVLKEGLKTGGASDQWYLDAYGKKGSYQEHFKAYGRTGLPCLKCKTPIKRSQTGQRGTFYCPECQQISVLR